VLWDTQGVYVDVEGHSAPLQDYGHLQVRENISLLDESDSDLHIRVETAKERLRQEIAFEENRSSSQRIAEFATNYVREVLEPWGGYDVGEYKFEQVGISELAVRARQRFFFVLAAEELLFALTERNPQKELEQLWYAPECDLFSGGLLIENDRFHVRPPLLFSLLLSIPISRIHRCSVCSDYFWAGRKDKSVCSARCGATKRKRKERDRYLEIKLGDRVPKKRVNAQHGTKKG
jgi:predicted nucleic acid-binding Zn ribbon protein